MSLRDLTRAAIRPLLPGRLFRIHPMTAVVFVGSFCCCCCYSCFIFWIPW